MNPQAPAAPAIELIGIDKSFGPVHANVDVATYKSFMDAKDGTWKPGIQALGLKEGGVDFAVDEWNKTVLTPDAKAAADAAKADIISGKIQVHDYMSDSKCPD